MQTKGSKRTRRTRRYRFNMLEMVLVMVIAVVGIVAVVGLFPIGLNQNRQAIGASMASDCAEQFLHYNASRIDKDWAWLNSFPDDKPGNDDLGIQWTTVSLVDNPHVTIAWPKLGPEEVFDPETDTSGLFRVSQEASAADGVAFTEFSSVIRMWKSDYESFENGAARARICAEISWPAEKAYADRDTEVYCLEMFNAGEITVQTAAGPCNGDAVNYPAEDSAFVITQCCPYVEIETTTPDATAEIVDLTYYWTDGTSSAFTDLAEMTGRWDASGNWIADSEGHSRTLARTSDTAAGADWETFVIDNTCSVLISASPGPDNSNPLFAGGTVEPSGVIPTQKNGSRVFNIVADTEYSVADVLVDGVSVGPVTTYTFTDVGESHHSITALFTFIGNHAPVATDDSYEVEEGSTLVVSESGILANDSDADGNTLAVALPVTVDTANGTLECFVNGAFSYTPDTGFVGIDTFQYIVTDGQDTSPTATVTIAVTSSNDCPVWPLSVQTISNRTTGVYFCVNPPGGKADDAESGQSLTYSLTSLDSPNGDWAYITSNRQIAGTPVCQGEFNYVLTASDGSCTADAQLTISVTDGNHAPTWPQSTQVIGNRTVGSYFCVDPPGGKANDAESGQSLTYTLTSLSGAAGDWAYVSTSRQIAGTPTTPGEYEYILTASDGQASVTAYLTIVVGAATN